MPSSDDAGETPALRRPRNAVLCSARVLRARCRWWVIESSEYPSDFNGRQAAPRAFAGGVVLYDGEAVASFGDGLYAVPLSGLWGAG